MNAIDLEVSEREIQPLIHREETPMDQTAVKTRTLWQKIKEVIGSWIRDLFFLPLSGKLSLNQVEFLNREEKFVKDFWDPNSPLDLNYPLQEKIRETFTFRDQPIRMVVDGQELEATCRIIETKEQGEESHNFVHVLGNLSTLTNNVTATYPFLASYLDQKELDPTLPPARFIVISQYSTKKASGEAYKPTNLEDSGIVLKKTLETIDQEYGTIHCVSAQSLGSVVLAASLKHLNPNLLPLINLDRAPSSIKEASKNHPIGFLLNFLADLTGWSIDIGRELTDYYAKGETSSCIISSVEHDFYFPGTASLAEHPYVKELQRKEQVKVVVFSPPLQLFQVRGHHILRSDFLNGNYLLSTSNQDFLKPRDHLANALMRHSFQQMKLQRQLVA